MQLISLDQVFRLLQPGMPLPFGVRDAEGRLLLSQGHVLHDQAKLTELLNRGMFVDPEEVARSRDSAAARQAAPARLFSSRWEALQDKLRFLLRAPGEPDFLQHLHEVVEQIAAFADNHTDEILFLILRHDYSQPEHYPEAHSLHVAALCHLVSHRLDWPLGRRHSLIGAALTMNLAMISLQAQLAGQHTPLSEAQRQEIEDHPRVGAALLRAAGLQDETWLRTVEQHHECPGGKGYPRHLQEPDEGAQLVRLCDMFAAKHSARVGRVQIPAHQAARDLYAQSGGHPLVAALIKECGIYPPGCYVRLASGEVAVVTHRGASAKEPRVAAVTNANGEALERPVERDTSRLGRAIVGTVAEKSIRRHFTADQLYS